MSTRTKDRDEERQKYRRHEKGRHVLDRQVRCRPIHHPSSTIPSEPIGRRPHARPLGLHPDDSPGLLPQHPYPRSNRINKSINKKIIIYSTALFLRRLARRPPPGSPRHAKSTWSPSHRAAPRETETHACLPACLPAGKGTRPRPAAADDRRGAAGRQGNDGRRGRGRRNATQSARGARGGEDACRHESRSCDPGGGARSHRIARGEKKGGAGGSRRRAHGCGVWGTCGGASGRHVVESPGGGGATWLAVAGCEEVHRAGTRAARGAVVAGVAVAGVRQRAAAGVRRARGRYSCPVSPCEEVVVRVRRPVVFSSAARLRRFGGRRSRAGRRRAEVCTCAGEGVRHRQVRCRGRAGAHVLRPAAATRTVRATPTSYYTTVCENVLE